MFMTICVRRWAENTGNGRLTIGYGHTNAAADPLKCTRGTRITLAQALTVLANDLAPVETLVTKAVKVPITQHQFDALVSFVFNTGKLTGTGLLGQLNAKNYGKVPDEFMKWVKSKGQTLRGLVRRRQAEVHLWSTPDHTTPA
jgi:lysozyme